MNRHPLRYQISTLRQLPLCQSNNSRFLHIQIDDFFNNRKIQGTRISVVHEEFGILFCVVMNATGDLITSVGDLKTEDWISWNMTTGELFKQLEKFGFMIKYAPGPDISSGQLDYLLELKKLGYNKIRLVNIHEYDKQDNLKYKPRVVGFRSEKLGDWLKANYSPSKDDYLDAIERGWAFNISAQSDSKKYTWDWLQNVVVNIDDLAYDASTDDIKKDLSLTDEPLKLNSPRRGLEEYPPNPPDIVPDYPPSES